MLPNASRWALGLQLPICFPGKGRKVMPGWSCTTRWKDCVLASLISFLLIRDSRFSAHPFVSFSGLTRSYIARNSRIRQKKRLYRYLKNLLNLCALLKRKRTNKFGSHVENRLTVVSKSSLSNQSCSGPDWICNVTKNTNHFHKKNMSGIWQNLQKRPLFFMGKKVMTPPWSSGRTIEIHGTTEFWNQHELTSTNWVRASTSCDAKNMTSWRNGTA